jgi:hypothetical protein
MDVGESVTLVVLLSKALKYLTTSKTSRALNRGLDQVGCRLHMERSDSERKTFAILNSSCNRQRRLVKSSSSRGAYGDVRVKEKSPVG